MLVTETEWNFVHEIKTKLIAEAEKTRVRRIVRRADKIDIRSPHELEILSHQLFSRDTARDIERDWVE